MAVSYAQIAALVTEWLWEGRIPRGEVTLIAGAGAVGKGQLLCDLAARVSTGRPMPLCDDGDDNPVTAPASVVMVTPEDDPEETMSWRLRAAGANLGKIYDFTCMEGGAPFELPGAVPALRALIDELGDVRLVVVDPLMAAVSRSIGTNLAARRTIAPLMRMARETGVAVVMVHHTVKSGQIAGSKGLTDILRYAYTVTKDPENEAIRVIRLEKGNNVPQQDDARYTLVSGEHGAPRVVWLSQGELAGRRTAWRDTVAAQAPVSGRAPVSPARAAEAGCRHPRRFGTPAQCGDCPARKLRATPPAPAAPRRPVTPPAPAQPRPRWVAFTAGPGEGPAVMVGDWLPGLYAARALCERKAGMPLDWQALDDRTWQAHAGGCGWAVREMRATAGRAAAG